VGKPSEKAVDTGQDSVAHKQKTEAANATHQQGGECVEGAGVPATPPSSISQQSRGHR